MKISAHARNYRRKRLKDKKWINRGTLKKHNPLSDKPYMWCSQLPPYGLVFSFKPRGANSHIRFNARHTAFTGWDTDRQRFVVAGNSPVPWKRLKGTWRWKEFGPSRPKVYFRLKTGTRD